MFTPLTWSKSPAKWLWITAVIELVVAAGLLAGGLAVPEAKGGLWLTAAILGSVSLALLVWAGKWSARYKEAQRISATGLPAQARIVGMSQTGVYLNEQPQVELTLELSTAVQGPYQVTLKEWVPLIMLGRLTSGQPLPVKVDPQNPQNVIIEWSAPGPAMPGAVAAAQAGPPEDPQDLKKRLLATGTAGTATVLEATETTDIDGEGRTVYDLTLRIEVPGFPAIEGPTRAGIPPEHIGHLEKGDTVPIKVDPQNPAMMAVDWESL
ncbi:MAG TPA: DUF3592 domain-containing protein [Actinomycetota bacterium]